MIKAFCTGSRVYGEPRQDSDLDLVILVDPFTLNLLQSVAEVDENELATGYAGSFTACLRFGKLNVLATTEVEYFLAWREGTEECMKLAGQRTADLNQPHLFGKITRDEAIDIIQAARERYGYNFDGPIAENPDA